MNTHATKRIGLFLAILAVTAPVAHATPDSHAVASVAPSEFSDGSDPASHGGPHDVSSCRVINEPGSYDVVADITNASADPCIEITASNVILDGNGHTIDGVDNTSVGVDVHGVNRTVRIRNVTVRDLTVTNWDVGIMFRYAFIGRITNNSVTWNRDKGISLAGYVINSNTDNITVDNNTVSNNDRTFSRGNGEVAGIETASNSNGVVLRDNNVSNNGGANPDGEGHGMFVRGNSSRVLDNFVSENPGIPLVLQGADHGVVRNNTVRDNGDGSGLSEHGIYVHGATDNVIAGNVFSGNAGAGIGVRVGFSSYIPARDNLIRNNTVRNNSAEGIKLTGAINTTLRGNTISGHNANLRIDGPYTRHFNHTITTTNTVAGKPVHYLVNESDVVIGAETDPGFVGVVSSHNVTVRDVTLDENTRYGAVFVNTTGSKASNVSVTGNARGGLLFQNSSGIVLSDSNVSNNRGDGVVLRGTSDMRIRNTTVSNNSDPPGFPAKDDHGFVWERAYEIEQFLDSAIRAEFGTVRNNTLRNNTISGHDKGGITVWNAEGTTLTGNNVSDSEVGITLGSSNRSRVVDNLLGNHDEGIVQFGARNDTIANNRLVDVLAEAVTLWGSGSSVTNNTILDAGIIVRSAGDDFAAEAHDIRNNTVSGAVDGVEISAGAEQVRVIGNNVTDASDGIQIYGRNATIADNRFVQNTDGIFVGSPGGDSTLRNNTVVRNFDGIVVESSGNRIVGNNVSDNENGIRVERYSSSAPARNNVLVNNTVRNNTDPGGPGDGNGILLRESHNTTLRGNVLARNARNLGVFGTALPHFDHTITRTNLVEGRPVFYLVNESDVRIDAADDPGYVGVVNSTNVTVGNVSLSGNHQGVLFANVVDSAIEHVTATDNRRGIDLIEANTVTARNTTLSNDSRGVRLTGTEHVSLIDSTVSGNTEGVVATDTYFHSPHNSTFVNNSISDNEESGVNIRNGHTLINNTASNNGRNGFRLEDNNTLIDNTASDNRNIGYRLGDGNVVINGTAVGNDGAGISAQSGNAVINTTAARNGEAGIEISFGDDNRVIDGTFSNNSQYGITVEGDRNVLGNNTASENRQGGIELQDSRNNTVINNTVTNNGGAGIRVSGTDHVLTNNTATGNEWGYVGAEARDNTVRRLRIGSATDPTTVSFTMKTGTGFHPREVKIRTDRTPPSDPSGYRNIGVHIEATADAEVAWLNLSIHYADGDVSGVNESTLSMWRHDGTAWSNVSGFNTVDTSRNTVSANVTTFSVFAPLAESETTCIAGAVARDDTTISLTEIQEAIDWWAENTPVPGTDGKTISLSKIQSLIDVWAEGATVSC